MKLKKILAATEFLDSEKLSQTLLKWRDICPAYETSCKSPERKGHKMTFESITRETVECI